MNRHARRSIGAVVGFSFAVVWIAAGFSAAVYSLLAAALGLAAVLVAERYGPTVSSEKIVADLRRRLASAAPARKARPVRRREVKQPSSESALESRYGW